MYFFVYDWLKVVTDVDATVRLICLIYWFMYDDLGKEAPLDLPGNHTNQNNDVVVNPEEISIYNTVVPLLILYVECKQAFFEAEKPYL